MRSYRWLDLIYTFSALVHATALDLPWSSSDDVFQSDIESPSDQAALPFSQLTPGLDDTAASLFEPADAPVDLGSSNLHAPGSDLGDLDNSKDLFASGSNLLSDNTVFNTGFDLSDCSPTDSLPNIGKSRARRRDDSQACPDPTVAGAQMASGSADDLSSLRDLFTGLETIQRLAGGSSTEDQNPACYEFTRGILPWGVCSSGNPDDELQLHSSLMPPAWVIFDIWLLRHCTMGM